MDTKSLSFFAVFFILFLVIFAEVPEIEAQLCVREYVGEIPLSNCSVLEIQLCHTKCRENNGAKAGICYVAGEGEDEQRTESFKCLCNFCSEYFCQI
ncbi:unnamed protein product [Brassica rapa]|uniref:Knottin scorpion toxin-like domain-containing protein n=2 Tax=Brassica TaxID=3705 RepID=A0A8D9I387_BRACM|nr:unnamed protein product [Brassica napus]CAG7908511.1 unnamed protein product [Brassica rapa]